MPEPGDRRRQLSQAGQDRAAARRAAAARRPVATLVPILLVAALGTACSEPRTPEEVVTHYLEAQYEGDLEEVYEILSREDRGFQSLERYQLLYGAEDSIVVQEVMRRSTFEIESLEVGADRAFARVRAREPNLPVVMNEVMAEALRGIGSGLDPGDFDDRLEDLYRHRPVPMRERMRGVVLVLEEARWRVSEGWPERDDVDRLVLQAQRAAEADAWERARDLYVEALERDPRRLELEQRIRSAEVHLLPPQERARRSRELIQRTIEEARSRRSGPFGYR